MSRKDILKLQRRGIAPPERPPLAMTTEFSGDRTNQTQWRAFVRKGRLVIEPPPFNEVVAMLSGFLLPPCELPGPFQGQRFRVDPRDFEAQLCRCDTVTTLTAADVQAPPAGNQASQAMQARQGERRWLLAVPAVLTRDVRLEKVLPVSLMGGDGHGSIVGGGRWGGNGLVLHRAGPCTGHEMARPSLRSCHQRRAENGGALCR